MPALLPTIGEIYYNGVTINVFSIFDLSGTSMYDRAQRTVSHVRWNVRISGYIQAANSVALDTLSTTYRQKLQRSGGELRFSGKGFGLLSVNSPANTRAKDVAFGPKPRVLSWKPLGGGNAAKIEWQVEVAYVECEDAIFEKGLMEANYRINYDIDRSGLTRRTISGYGLIPMTRRNIVDRTLPDNADAYREQLNPTLLPGFRRVSRNVSIDESKRQIDFTVVDEELPTFNIPPPGVIEVSATHDVSNISTPNPNEDAKANLSTWAGRLSATFEFEKGVDRHLAYKLFFELYRQRTAEARALRNKTPILAAFSMAENNIYGKEAATLTCTYRFACSVQELLVRSGLWEPVSGFNGEDRDGERRWRQSLEPGAWSARGLANLAADSSSDVIIDLCDRRKPPPPESQEIPSFRTRDLPTLRSRPRGRVGAGGFDSLPSLRGGGGTSQNPLLNPLPSEDSSWLHYDAACWLEIEDAVSELKPLPKYDPTPQPQKETSGSPIDTASVRSASNVLAGGTGITEVEGDIPALSSYRGLPALRGSDSIVQYRTTPRLRLVFEGRAMRAGYVIPIPGVKSVGDQKVRQANRGTGYQQKVLTAAFGLTVYVATWHFEYIVPNVPSTSRLFTLARNAMA